MDACGCGDAFASIFDERTARRDVDRYRKKGPDRTTRMLLDLVRARGVEGATILDVGGGIGVIDQELLRAGAARATIVDGSAAYLDAARSQATAAGLIDHIELIEGDFVRRASEIGAADVVTLDRVVCCYPDAEALVRASAVRAGRVYGLVLPRDRWLVRIATAILNLGSRLRREAYRAYAHRNTSIDELVAAAGLLPGAETGTILWRVVVYDRRGGAEAEAGGPGRPKPPAVPPTES